MSAATSCSRRYRLTGSGFLVCLALHTTSCSTPNVSPSVSPNMQPAPAPAPAAQPPAVVPATPGRMSIGTANVRAAPGSSISVEPLWADCVSAASRRFARSTPEPAAAVVASSFGTCAVLARTFSANLQSNLRVHLTPILMSFVLNVRIEEPSRAPPEGPTDANGDRHIAMSIAAHIECIRDATQVIASTHRSDPGAIADAARAECLRARPPPASSGTNAAWARMRPTVVAHAANVRAAAEALQDR
jgi:hypothetical protein